VDSYADAVNGSDGVPGAFVNAANGLASGTTLPHFSQVWSSTAQDVVYNADQLLAQMAGPAGNGQSALYHGNSTPTADGGVVLAADGSQHLQSAVYQYVFNCIVNYKWGCSGFPLRQIRNAAKLIQAISIIFREGHEPCPS